ncbi:hypothetical protein SUGI_0372000 [Cryptomeria japonica]|nr:hypothetical protein SUGI_0372000 [Cryptomeria japonica]
MDPALPQNDERLVVYNETRDSLIAISQEEPISRPQQMVQEKGYDEKDKQEEYRLKLISISYPDDDGTGTQKVQSLIAE